MHLAIFDRTEVAGDLASGTMGGTVMKPFGG